MGVEMSRELKILQNFVNNLLLGIHTHRKLLQNSAKEEDRVKWEVNKALLNEYRELYAYIIRLYNTTGDK